MSATFPPTPTPSTHATSAALETQAAITFFPQRPEDRLRLALRRLNEAVAEQSDATAGLRAAIGDLASTMARLGHSVSGYRGALDSTAAEIERALASSRTLQATADRMAV
jgi:septal ring factor EnvC (AmiA/AmiB activator)